jgi:hypothetical protein
MPEVQVTKTCKACHTAKPLDEFYRDATTRDGLRGKCKACLYAATQSYRKTPRGKEVAAKVRREYRASFHGQAVESAYRKSYARKISVWKYTKTNKFKAGVAKYRATENYRIANARRRERQPEKIYARSAVNHAAASGQIPDVRTLKCVQCLCCAEEYHHWSYKPKWRLSVIPLCKHCHWLIHYV